MVNLMLYIVIYCKQVHYTTDSLVWGLLKLTPITAVTGSEVMIFQINNGASNYFIWEFTICVITEILIHQIAYEHSQFVD